MTKIELLKDLLKKYKELISLNKLKDEKYKWELLHSYKGKPNLEAPNYKQEILDVNYHNLVYYNAKAVLHNMVNSRPEKTKIILEILFNEQRDLKERIEEFQQEFLQMYREAEPHHELAHHQDERTISSYLAVKYPDKYPFYKYSFYRRLCDYLNEKPASKGEQYIHYIKLNKELADLIKSDEELTNLAAKFLGEYRNEDPNNLLLAQDVLYQIFEKNEAKEIDKVRADFNEEEFDFYIEWLRNITTKFSLPYEDDRVTYNVRDKRLIFTVGQRYSVVLFKQSNKTYLNIISTQKETESFEEFAGTNPNPFLNVFPFEERAKINIENHYLAIENELKRTTKSSFKKDENIDLKNLVYNLEESEEMTNKYYLLGAYWSDDTPKDQTDRFIEEGVWINGYKDKFTDEVNKIEVGSHVAIKSSYTREKTKSVMNIKAVGVVTENQKDGRNIKVAWNTSFNSFEVDFGGYLNTVKEVTNKQHIKSIWDNKKEAFKKWLELNDKYDNSNKSKSYLRAIDILEQELSIVVYDENNIDSLNDLYLDLIDNQRDKQGKYFYEKAQSYGEKGFYSAAVQAYIEFLKDYSTNTIRDNKMNALIQPLNKILYGPPGTGKTYKLKNDYFHKYTLQETSISKEQHFTKVASSLTWWQVIALALVELGDASVSDILNNRWVVEKASLSESKNVRATLWGTLQMHTIENSKFVNYKQRQVPYIFDKKENKTWVLLKNELDEQNPELYEILDSVNNFKANPNKTIENYDFVTFHQSFSYEDFIEGIKPVMPIEGEETDGLQYKVEDGVFKTLCRRAEKDPDNRYAIFIDEINRGNVSSIFGELITLIELDKRKGAKNQIIIKLPYSKTTFSVPSNLDIYGTMNTADRSVEALDTALRRRFSFEELLPKPSLLNDLDYKEVDLEQLLDTINQRIEFLIDKDHQIGHSYFFTVKSLGDLKLVFQDKIIPLLEEYFYGDYGKIGLVLGESFIEEKHTQNKNILASFKAYSDVDFIADKKIFKLKDISNMTVADFKSIYETV